MHAIILLLTRPAGLAVQIGCMLVLTGACVLTIRLVRRPDYRAIHRMEREHGITPLTVPVRRRKRGR